jgi:GntR family transcriptional regulator, transcriptional repressor for pyruvate dehydrogenase complex
VIRVAFVRRYRRRLAREINVGNTMSKNGQPKEARSEARSMSAQPVRRVLRRSRSLAVDLVDTLHARINDGTYATGIRMPTEAEIMADHGVSRTVVREAVSRLQQARLVVTQHGIGSFVSESLPQDEGFRINAVDVETVVDIVNVLELRVSLETESAGLAATRRNLR